MLDQTHNYDYRSSSEVLLVDMIESIGYQLQYNAICREPYGYFLGFAANNDKETKYIAYEIDNLSL